MPFLSLTDETVETINLLLQYFLEGNLVKHADIILKHYPDCSVTFANELQRLTHLQKHTQQDSAAIAFLCLPTPHQPDYLFRLEQENRGIDSSWEFTQGHNKILLIIMPMTSHAGVEGYRMRINQLLENEFGILLNGDKIRFKSCQLSSFNNPIFLLNDLLDIT